MKMKNLILIFILFCSGILFGQNRTVDLQLRGASEKFIQEFNNNDTISFNLDLDAFEEGLKGFQRAVDDPTKLVTYVTNNSIDLNSGFGRSFKAGIIAGYIWKDQSTGWEDITQLAKNQWDTWVSNNNPNIHSEAPGKVLLYQDFVSDWIVTRRNNFATVTVNTKALYSGLFTVINGEVIIPQTMNAQQATWIRENVNLVVYQGNEYFTFDNFHWFRLVEQ
jgi:hypothetical protein